MLTADLLRFGQALWHSIVTLRDWNGPPTEETGFQLDSRPKPQTYLGKPLDQVERGLNESFEQYRPSVTECLNAKLFCAYLVV